MKHDYVYFMILPFLSNQTEYVSWYPLFFSPWVWHQKDNDIHVLIISLEVSLFHFGILRHLQSSFLMERKKVFDNNMFVFLLQNIICVLIF